MAADLECQREAAQILAVAHIRLIASGGDHHHLDILVLHQICCIGSALLNLQNHLNVLDAVVSQMRCCTTRSEDAKAELLQPQPPSFQPLIW